jgi:CheY-like chemotaxis protein
MAWSRMPESRRTILVVDDDEDVLEMATAYLEQQGYRVLHASNGTDGLRILQGDATIDLLFTDIVMPGGMDGFELAHQAKQVRPQLRVLYTSGFFKEMPRKDVHVEGDLLPKPWRLAHLEEAVKRAFN